jgi:hypothetical protein
MNDEVRIGGPCPDCGGTQIEHVGLTCKEVKAARSETVHLLMESARKRLSEEPPLNDLMTRAEFDAELLAMEKKYPLLKRMREDSRIARFDGWPQHLKDDAYKKMGVEPVVMYRRVAKANE